MGLEYVSFIIMDISLESPCNSLYEFPARPCSLRHLSNLFGLSHTQFSSLHTQLISTVRNPKEIATELSFISGLRDF